MWLTVASRSAPGASAEAIPTDPLASATAPAPATNQRLRNTLHLRVLVVPHPRRADATSAGEPRQLGTFAARSACGLGRGRCSRGAVAQAGGRVAGGGELEVRE